MSNNQDLIQTLEKTITESQKNIRVLNAVKDVDNFIVISIAGNTVTSTSSDGMNVSSAVVSLATAIRSYAEKLHNSDDVNALLNIINAEVDQISEQLQDLILQERTDQELQMSEPEVADYSPMDAPSRAPTAKHPAAKGVPHK